MSATSSHSAVTTAPQPDIAVTHRILIVSASVGAGHDGAARELKGRLEARGHFAIVEDFATAFPLGLGWFFRWLYGRMLELAPWSYDAIYKIMPFLYTPVSFAEHHITQHSLRKWVKTHKPDVIVSTYPLASLALGRMRMGGKLRPPVITYITDFHSHSLVTHEGVDLHVAIHDITRNDAMKAISGAVVTRSPLVGEQFRNATPQPKDRSAASGIIAMVVAGSWGAGEVEATVRDLIKTGNVTPVVICGQNQHLFDRISHIHKARAVGWTTEMPSLMAGADVLIDNAGGLTAMEALAAGVPVINYRPLAGHGRDNAMDMQNAGVVTVAHDIHELAQAVTELGRDSDKRRTQIKNGVALFNTDATDDVLAYAAGVEVPLASIIPLAKAERAKLRKRRMFSTVAAGVLAISLGLTTGVGEATAHGVGSDRTDYDSGTYVGVRASAAEIDDPQIQAMLKSLPITLVVDGRTAQSAPATIRDLAVSGVDIANGGSGRHDPGWAPWTRAKLDLESGSAEVNASAGVQPRTFVPGRHLDGFDLWFTHHTHTRALPTAKVVKPGDETATLASHGVYVIDGRNQTLQKFRERLSLLSTLMQNGQAQIHPLADIAG